MTVDVESLCLGCMEPKRAGACPNPETCGWTGKSDSGFFSILPPGFILEDRYLLGKFLGQGGFGITYLAADLAQFRKLAVKEYFPCSYAARSHDRHTVTYMGPENREPYEYGLKKFEEEARTLATFQAHPNIVEVIRSFNANRTSYIVMEYLDGVTLQGHLKAHSLQRISFDETMRILEPMFEALRHVHEAGIIHRDVSPDNIYLCRSGAVKLLDFGAARMAFRDQTRSQQLILKPGFTPLEQYHSSGVPGPYTDVYSLAATIYRSITGVVPPEAPERLSEDRLIPPSRLAEIPARAEKALLTALAVRHKHRYQSIDEFYREICPPPEPQPDPVPPTDTITRFTVLWLAAAALMCAGSLLRPEGLYLLFCPGLLPAVLAVDLLRKLRGSRSAPPGILLLFILIAAAGIIGTAIDFRGALLIFANTLVGRAIMSTPPARKEAVPAATFAIRFLSGDFAGNSLPLATAPIVIGRLPDMANVVLPLPEVSGAHAKAWADKKGAGVWIEDLNSRNGTYVLRGGSHLARWSNLKGKALLVPGDRFYVSGEDIASFEIEAASA